MGNLSIPLPLCEQGTDVCHSEEVAITLMILNIVCILTNIVHIAVLKSMPSLRGKPYLTVLVIVSASDVLYSVAGFLQNSCHIRRALLTTSLQTLWAVLKETIIQSSMTFRYITVCLSSIERYIAVCQPYTTYKAMVHLGKISVILHLVIFAIFFGLMWMSRYDFCVDSLLGPVNESSTAILIVVLCIIWVALVVTIASSSFILREIHRMKRRAPVNEDAQLRKTSRYIILINAAFHIIMTPPAMMPVVILVRQGEPSRPLGAIYYVIIAHASFGIFNTVLYGFMFQPYRTQLRKMFGFWRCKPTPPVDVTRVSPPE